MDEMENMVVFFWKIKVGMRGCWGKGKWLKTQASTKGKMNTNFRGIPSIILLTMINL